MSVAKLGDSRLKKGYKEYSKNNILLNLLKEVPDYRKKQGKKHQLHHILYLSILAGLMGATDYKQISIWIESFIQDERIKKLLGVEFIATPKRSCVSSILANVDSESLEAVFRKWINQYVQVQGKHLAIDGKVMNGSKHKNKKSIEIVSAVLSESGVIIGHQKIAENSNEIPAVRELIESLGDNFIFTFDAINTQKKL